MHESNKIISKNNRTEYLFQFLPIEHHNIPIYNNQISVNIYMFDALSRFRFFNQMPYTNRYLNKLKRNFFIYNYEMYHTIGINSCPNYFPLFYGSYRNETPKEFFYNYYIKNNYTIISNLAECDLKLGLCNNNRTSMINIKHNLQISCDEIINVAHYSWGPRCVGHKQHHEWQMKYVEDSLIYYHNKRQKTFSYTSFDEPHDQSFISLTRVDKDFADHIKKLHSIFHILFL